MFDIKLCVNEASAVAITTDFWMSQANEAYCGITGHWLKMWDMQSAVLQCINVPERHTAHHVADLFRRFADEWCITGKFQAIVTDNARNMVSAVAQTDFVHLPCLAHSTELSILHGFKAAD